MKRYRAVMLGAGWRGLGHTKAFLANADRFELTALCDMNTARAHEMLAKIGASLKVYADAQTMLQQEKPEVFCFATQPNIRLDLVRLGLRHGVQAIAYEKPMALSLAEARSICEECDQAGVKQIVCHQHRYGRHWQAVKELVDAGRIGKVQRVHASSKGWYFYYITHLVDYTLWMLGYPQVKWIAGRIHGRSRFQDSHRSPGYAAGEVCLSDETRASFECGPLAPDLGVAQKFWYNAGITLYGSEGMAQVIAGRGWRAITRDSQNPIGDLNISLDEIGDTVPYLADLARWMDDDSKPHPCRGELAYRGLEISMGILLSALEQRVIVPPIDPALPVVERMLSELPADPFVEAINS